MAASVVRGWPLPCVAALVGLRSQLVARTFGHSASMLTRHRRGRSEEGPEGLLPLLSPKAASTQLPPPPLRCGSVQPGPCEAAFPFQPHRSRGPGKQRATGRCFAAQGEARWETPPPAGPSRKAGPTSIIASRTRSPPPSRPGPASGACHGIPAQTGRSRCCRPTRPRASHTGVSTRSCLGDGAGRGLSECGMGDLPAMGRAWSTGPQRGARQSRGVLEDQRQGRAGGRR